MSITSCSASAPGMSASVSTMCSIRRACPQLLASGANYLAGRLWLPSRNRIPAAGKPAAGRRRASAPRLWRGCGTRHPRRQPDAWWPARCGDDGPLSIPLPTAFCTRCCRRAPILPWSLAYRMSPAARCPAPHGPDFSETGAARRVARVSAWAAALRDMPPGSGDITWRTLDYVLNDGFQGRFLGARHAALADGIEPLTPPDRRACGRHAVARGAGAGTGNGAGKAGRPSRRARPGHGDTSRAAVARPRRSAHSCGQGCGRHRAPVAIRCRRASVPRGLRP